MYYALIYSVWHRDDGDKKIGSIIALHPLRNYKKPNIFSALPIKGCSFTLRHKKHMPFPLQYFNESGKTSYITNYLEYIEIRNVAKFKNTKMNHIFDLISLLNLVVSNSLS